MAAQKRQRPNDSDNRMSHNTDENEAYEDEGIQFEDDVQCDENILPTVSRRRTRKDLIHDILRQWARSAGNYQGEDVLQEGGSRSVARPEGGAHPDPWLQLKCAMQRLVDERLGPGTFKFPNCSNREAGVRCNGLIVVTERQYEHADLRQRRQRHRRKFYVCTRCILGADQNLLVCWYCRDYCTCVMTNLVNHMSRCAIASMAGACLADRNWIAEEHNEVVNGNPFTVDKYHIEQRDLDGISQDIKRSLEAYKSSFEDDTDIALHHMHTVLETEELCNADTGACVWQEQQERRAEQYETHPQWQQMTESQRYTTDISIDSFRQEIEFDKFVTITSKVPQLQKDDLSHQVYTCAAELAVSQRGLLPLIQARNVVGFEPYRSEIEAISHQTYRLAGLSKEQQAMLRNMANMFESHGCALPEDGFCTGDRYSRIENNPLFPRLRSESLITGDNSTNPEQRNVLEHVIARSLNDPQESGMMRFIPSFRSGHQVERHHTVETPYFDSLVRTHCADGALCLAINVNTDKFDTTRQNLGINAYACYFEYANLDYQQRAKKRHKHVYSISKKKLPLHVFIAALCLDLKRLYRGIIVYHGAYKKYVVVRPLLNLLINDQPERDAVTNTTSFNARIGCSTCIIPRNRIHDHQTAFPKKNDMSTRHGMFQLNRIENYQLRQAAQRSLSIRVQWNSFWMIPYVDVHHISVGDILHIEVIGNWRDHHFRHLWHQIFSETMRQCIIQEFQSMEFSNINTAQLKMFKTRNLGDLRGWNADHWMSFLAVSPFLLEGRIPFDLFKGWMHHLIYYRVLYHPTLSADNIDFAEMHWHRHCDLFICDIAGTGEAPVSFIKFHLPQHLFSECKELTATCCNANTKMFEAIHSPNKSAIAQSPRTGAAFAFKIAEIKKTLLYHYSRFSTKKPKGEWFPWSDSILIATHSMFAFSQSKLARRPRTIAGYIAYRIKRDRKEFNRNDFVRFGPRLDQCGIISHFDLRSKSDGSLESFACINQFRYIGIEHYHLCPTINTSEFAKEKILVHVQSISIAMVIRYKGKEILNVFYKG